MKKNFKLGINYFISVCLAGFCVFLLASSAYADGVILSDSGGGTYHSSRGYNSDATIAKEHLRYADHNTTEWQELGAPNSYGVSWRRNGGDFGHDDLYVGDSVTFRFNLHSENVGNHYANLLKAWIDWNATDTTYEFENSETVVEELKELRASMRGAVSSDYTFDTGRGDLDSRDDDGFGNDDEYYEYTISLTAAHLGTAYLRARVTCSDSVVYEEKGCNYSWSDQWGYTEAQYLAAFDAYSDYGQGEIEDWKITVLKESNGNISSVPEPATFVLFGMGLIGIARVSRKKV
ncbi:PEP-CTERM sorting domain-containing protein [uncultured Desulfobacter sp.]|uniref:PEP-CTERM sorting domain-containing protein n=1 Tax=uncultured Desulfobacter sp. TaxID=240139 RepID=UPI0029F5AF54|nr:PEP-CTERM sorting domain-containing protein [uncultured Desulfobacter sp.]